MKTYTKVIRIAIIDDHQIMREGFELLLGSNPGIEVCCTFGSAEEALDKMNSHAIDVCICDISLPQMDGIDLCRKIKETNSSVNFLMLSMHQEPMLIRKSLEAGALGYVNKSTDNSQLVAAISSVSKGQYFVPQEAISILMDKKQPYESEDIITPREKEIAEALKNGKKNNDIAEQLGISPATVNRHKANLIKKLGLKSTADLMIYLMK